MARHHERTLTDGEFVFDTRSLGRRAGTLREVSRAVVLTEHIGLDLIGLPVDSQVELDLQLQSVSEGVLVTGAVRGELTGECVRCLESFTEPLELSLTELFVYPASKTDKTTDDDEMYRLQDDHIDLRPVIIDEVGLLLPLQPVCSADCPGLCSECGVRLAIAESGHSHEILDPRWAGLAAKFGTDTAGS